MKILVISDSHGSLRNVETIVERHPEIDMVIHCGDIVGQDDELKEICRCPMTVVKGNCDFYSANKDYEIVEADNHAIFVTHGHRYGVDWGTDELKTIALYNECDIALYGHTHVPDTVVDEENGIWIFNPGSVSRPRQLNGLPCFLILDTSEDEIKWQFSYL